MDALQYQQLIFSSTDEITYLTLIREPNSSHKVLNRIYNFLKPLSDIIYKKTNKFAKLYSKMPGAIPQHTTFCVT